MPNTVVDRLFGEFNDLIKYLDERKEISLRSAAESNFSKSLLLAAASYFERRICSDMVAFVVEQSHTSMVVDLVQRGAIRRQYHTFFDWDAGNANKFFSLFGNGFKEFMTARIREDTLIAAGIRNFIEIGRDRNRMVHEDFGTYTLEKTAEEIYIAYKSALVFVDGLAGLLRECPQASALVKIVRGSNLYHRADCRHVTAAAISTSGNDARRSGFTPCRSCSPP